MAEPEVSSSLYRSCYAAKGEEAARQHAHRLVLDSRDHRDGHDRRTVQKALGHRPSKTALIYEHVDSKSEPLLWISDAVAWCFGAAGDWRRRAGPLVSDAVDL